jgi:hypothetical protein
MVACFHVVCVSLDLAERDKSSQVSREGVWLWLWLWQANTGGVNDVWREGVGKDISLDSSLIKTFSSLLVISWLNDDWCEEWVFV